MAVTINAEECIGCGICVDMCPNQALELVDEVAVLTNEEACAACGACETNCEYGIIQVDIEEKRFHATY